MTPCVMPSGASTPNSALCWVVTDGERDSRMIEIITQEHQKVTPWAGGSTRELAIWPAHSSLAARDFAWRFSSAEVNASGAFSDFSGYQRYLAIRQGGGLQLHVDAHQMTLRTPQYVAVFGGHATTRGELLDGPVRDINLIVRLDPSKPQQSPDVELLPVQLQATPLFLTRAQPRLWLLYADAGAVQVALDGQQWTIPAGALAKVVAPSLQLSAQTPTAAVVASVPADVAA